MVQAAATCPGAEGPWGRALAPRRPGRAVERWEHLRRLSKDEDEFPGDDEDDAAQRRAEHSRQTECTSPRQSRERRGRGGGQRGAPAASTSAAASGADVARLRFTDASARGVEERWAGSKSQRR